MLQIVIPKQELWNEVTQEFSCEKEQKLQLEHSLISLAKWEAKWKKPFLNPKTPRTIEESRDYIRCMTITQNVDPKVYDRIGDSIMEKINRYIDDPMTATWFSDKGKSGKVNRDIITAELIYYWMIKNGIPDRFEKWHLNRLLTLIRVCDNNNAPPKKMSQREVIKQYAEINEARRKALHTKG